MTLAAASAPSALSALYPHLAQSSAEPSAAEVAKKNLSLHNALCHSLAEKVAESTRVQALFFAENAHKLIHMAQVLADGFAAGGTLFTLGNGGSSCDAAHIAVEFGHPVTTGRVALPAINLSQDMAMLTAVGNDVGFAHVYSRQVVAHVRSGDMVLAVSTSGNSENLLNALLAARTLGARTLALSGGADGGRIALPDAAELCLVAPSSSIHRVQECHVQTYHVLWDLVHTLLAQRPLPVRGVLHSAVSRP